MIIIEMMILFFIQIKHTFDLPSTGTLLVYYKLDVRSLAFVNRSRQAETE